jgi:DNA invertase Pin-like site-specific DNA recombinase
MPRNSASPSIDDIVRDAMEGVIKRASVSIARAVADMAAARLSEELEAGVSKARGGKGLKARAPRGSRPRAEITRWVADRRARRVPNFVIDQTGLKTKKAIVARFGEDAAFEKGKPLPPKAKGAA